MPKLLIAAVLLLLAAPVPTKADETWSNPDGTASYEADIGRIAVISIPMHGNRIRLYLEGLGGNYDNRSISQGYWLGPGSGSCSATLTAPDGEQSSNWGRVTMIFDGPAFPTGWTATLGNCFDAEIIRFRADLD